MVNFRFHLVSITAVFLALAAGITIGAGVVDRATVDRIEGQLRDVAERREATNSENDRLRTDVDRWAQFSDQAATQVLEGRLSGATVFMVATTGVDRQLIEQTRDILNAAGAAVDGTLWFTGRWRLGDGEEARQLAGILDAAPTTRPSDLRAAGLIGVTTAWGAGDSGPLVAALVDGGFLEFEASPSTTVPLVQLPRPDSLFVVISGDGADVPTADLARPLVEGMSAAGLPVLAAQPTRLVDPGAEGGVEPPPEFVMSLRADPALASRITTVDNVDDLRGRVATVLALDQLRSGRTGHYGFGPDARIVPERAA